MGTRSNIGLMEPNGTCHVIYSHWDGYPSHHAPILLGFDEEKVRHLISLGSISQLQPRLDPVGLHSFDSPEVGTTVAYCRDRGGELEVRECAKEAVLQQEYAYLYIVLDKKWVFMDNSHPWLDLSNWDETHSES